MLPEERHVAPSHVPDIGSGSVGLERPQAAFRRGIHQASGIWGQQCLPSSAAQPKLLGRDAATLYRLAEYLVMAVERDYVGAMTPDKSRCCGQVSRSFGGETGRLRGSLARR